MKILLVMPRFVKKYGQFYHFPLGLAYIAAALKSAGYEVVGLNCNHSNAPPETLVEQAIRQHDPDVCATGALSPYLPRVQEIFRTARRVKPSIINIVGGGVLSSDPEAGPEIMDIDYGVVGEGEETIVDLIRTLQTGGEPQAVQGIVLRDRHGQVRRTAERPPILDLETIAWPDFDLFDFEFLLDLSKHYSYGLAITGGNARLAMMTTSRSCPYYCTFCFHPSGKTYRERPLDDFFLELDALKARYDVNGVVVVDELFSLKKARIHDFCDRIKPYGMDWMVQLHSNVVDEAVLEHMQDAGCSCISYGIESMNQVVLDSMRKKTKAERIDRALRLSYERRIGIQGNLIFGDTAETLETANESMRFWAGNREYMLNLAHLMVYPGSPDYIEAVRDGLITERTRYILDQSGVNISAINDTDLYILDLKIGIFQASLLELAPVVTFERTQAAHPLIGETYTVVWDCPRCQHRNVFAEQALTTPDQSIEDIGSIRTICRCCANRYDLRNPIARDFEQHPDKALADQRFERAGALASSGEDAAAVTALQEIASAFDWYYPAHLALAERSFRRGQVVKAFEHMHKALTLNPFSVECHRSFADLLMEEGAVAAARMHCRQILILHPGDAGAEAMIARMDGPEFDGARRETFFLSHSDAPPPKRLRGKEAGGTPRKRDLANFPNIAALEQETAGLLRNGQPA